MNKKIEDLKILVLGAGELAKEFIIAVKRYGVYVIAIDKYSDAPGMQVADEADLCNMSDGYQLTNLIARHKPDIIVPEVEAICVKKLFDFEKQGIKVIPSANAVSAAMNRLKLREQAVSLGLKCARYRYINSIEELRFAFHELGGKIVVKPLMSSSGKGQTIVDNPEGLEEAFSNLQKGRGEGLTRIGDKEYVAIAEEFIDFDFEVTLLTVTQHPRFNKEVMYCPMIGHKQEQGDYRESWQPELRMTPIQIAQAQEMAKIMVENLGGEGVWGVEFFVKAGGDVYFSELSPRPHDTGMVTLAHTQTFNEFELHARCVLALPIHDISLERPGASTAIVAVESNNSSTPSRGGYASTANVPQSDFRIFRKPMCWVGRRMGVALAYSSSSVDMEDMRSRARQVANCLQFTTNLKK